MKVFVVILVLVLAAVGLGWVTYHRTGDTASIDVNTDVIRKDLGRAEEAAEEGGRKAAEAGRRAVEQVKRTDVDVDVRRRPADEPAGTE